MAEQKFDPEKMIYCPEHKIWYHTDYKKEADKHRLPPEKDEYRTNLFIYDCPMCQTKNTAILSRSMVTPEESAQCRNLTGGPRINLLGKERSPITTKRKKFKN
jgi:hypothetical protein